MKKMVTDEFLAMEAKQDQMLAELAEALSKESCLPLLMLSLSTEIERIGRQPGPFCLIIAVCASVGLVRLDAAIRQRLDDEREAAQ